MPISREDAWRAVDNLDLDVDPSTLDDRIVDLAQAIVDDAPEREIDALLDQATAAVWDADLLVAVREAVAARLEELADERAALDLALHELDVSPDGIVARVVVERLALEFADNVTEVEARLAALDGRLDSARPEERASLALEAVAEVAGAIDLGNEEVSRLLSLFLAVVGASGREAQRAADALDAYCAEIGWDERREAVREAVASLAEACEDHHEALAASLRELLEDPMPSTAAADDLWRAALGGLAARLAF